MTHWTATVYQTHGHLLYDVEGALFQNESLTAYELTMLRQCAAAIGATVASPVLDIACGPGRHAWRLSEELFSVTGIDFSQPLLEIARSAALRTRDNGCRPRFIRADIRALPVSDGSFPTALILGNSFGYFSDEENLAVLHEAHRALGDGGFLCLEVTDQEAYLPGLKAFEAERITSGTLGELESKWWRRWDAECRRVRTQERHCHRPTGALLYEGSYDVRLYERGELEAMLERTGFRSVFSLAASPADLELANGLGESLGSVGKVLFVGALK